MGIHGRAIMSRRRTLLIGYLVLVLVAAACSSPRTDDYPYPDTLPSTAATGLGTTTDGLKEVPGYWWGDLGNIPLGTARDGNATARALGNVWSFYGAGQEDQYGYPEIVSAKQEGLSAPPGGDHVIKLEHNPGDPATQHKLFKFFTTKNWPGGAEPFRIDEGTPDDVSGRYVTYLYIPSAKLKLTPRGWLNIAQFKEGYSLDNGHNDTDPSWWLVIYNRNGRPTLDLAHWFEGDATGESLDLGPYLDKWVKIEMRLYQHDRLEVYLNDKRFDVVHNPDYPIGRLRYVGQTLTPGSGPAVSREEGWVFGTGNYSSPDDPASGSLMYVSLSTVLPLPGGAGSASPGAGP